VYLDPSNPPAPPVSHVGQEFNYVIEGSVKVTVNKKEHILAAGDSIYFDATLPHGQCAVGSPARFITIIQKNA
jgi:quercetin dioxygenase-like cupin family protein